MLHDGSGFADARLVEGGEARLVLTCSHEKGSRCQANLQSSAGMAQGAKPGVHPKSETREPVPIRFILAKGCISTVFWGAAFIGTSGAVSGSAIIVD